MLSALDARSTTSCSALAGIRLLSDEARRRLDPERNVRGFLDDLLRDGLVSDCLDVIAHLLPKRYAIAWGCECLQASVAAGDAGAVERSALAAAQRWLKDPTEENRRAAQDLAERLDYDTPGAWLAAAAGWSGGSLAPAELPEVAPPPTLCGEAVAAALKLAAAADAGRYRERLREFVSRALQAFAPAAGPSGAGA